MFEDNELFFDEMTLEYDIFLAEQEYFERVLYLGSNIYHETAGLITIHEGFIQSIIDFIKRIIEGIQRAWNTFKKKVVEFHAEPIIKRAKRLLPTYTDGDTVIENFHVYNLKKIFNQPSDLSTKVESIEEKHINSFETKEDLYEHLFSAFDFYKDKDKSITDNYFDWIIESTEDEHKLTTTEIKEMINFCIDYPDCVAAEEKALKDFNKSMKSIERTLNLVSDKDVDEPPKTKKTKTEVVTQQKVTNSVQSQGTESSKQETVDMLLDYYIENVIMMEADDNDNKSIKVSTGNNKNEEEKDNKPNISAKKWQWLISGLAETVSAELKILKRVYSDYLKILQVTFPRSKDEDKKKKKKSKIKKEKITKEEQEKKEEKKDQVEV